MPRGLPVATLQQTGNAGQLVLSDLPAAPRGKIYEVWIETRRAGAPDRRAVRRDRGGRRAGRGAAICAAPAPCW